MGYYTRFRLEAQGTDIPVDALVREWADENNHADYCLRGEQEGKWYQHETDLKEFSRKHPEATLVLCGEGEESGDIWKLYAKDGVTRKVKARIVFEDVAP